MVTLQKGYSFISAQLSTDAVSALRKVWVLVKLWKQHTAPKHARKDQLGPPRVKTTKKKSSVSIQMILVLFVLGYVMLFYQDKTQSANFRGNPLYQATKPKETERQCPQTTTFLKRKGSRSGVEPRPFCRLPALPLGQTGSQRLENCIEFAFD